ncbi:MAG: FAD-binding protein, partial [Proteobacteria bacterium]|nr:FAD-binding protein [Pseudomonadota bacterium]
NAVVCDGGGHIPAIDTGVVPMGNMEAVQFHPTGICPTDILVTEGCRGDGGTLLDVNEERFMDTYEPEKAELASRDVVSRWMTHHIRQGKGVKSPYGDHLWLDIRHLGEKHITGKLREVYEICTSFLGVDPIHQLIPVKPTQHYSMGGVRTNGDGAAYGLKGLFSAGEAACWDMHGFNRLGGNSLAETVVAGGIVGRKIVEFVQGAEVIFNSGIIDAAGKAQAERINKLVEGKNGSENVYKVRTDMQVALDKGANIFRTQEGLEECVESLQKTLDRARKVGLKSGVGVGAAPELMAALRIEGQVKMALMVAYGALMRTESRGSHNREDFTARNDRDWLKRTLAYWKNPDDMLPTLEYEPFSTRLDILPGYRGYGKMDIIPMEGLDAETGGAGEKGDK